MTAIFDYWSFLNHLLFLQSRGQEIKNPPPLVKACYISNHTFWSKLCPNVPEKSKLFSAELLLCDSGKALVKYAAKELLALAAISRWLVISSEKLKQKV